MSSLTARYVHAATRRLPEDQRSDVGRELEADIGDRIDSLLAGEPGMDAERAEHAALSELGDPDRLAAGYSGSPQHLVGAELYPSYVRALKAITVSVVPVVVVVVAAIEALTGGSVGAVAGEAAWMAFMVTTQIAFWVTLSYAIVERSTAREELSESVGAGPWTPEQLPELPRGARGSLGEAITNIVWLAILGGAIVWQHVASPLRAEDERLPVLDPGLWSFWLPLILVLLVAEAAFEVAKYRAGGVWTRGFAALNTVLALAFAAPVVYLAADQRLLNPEAVTRIQADWAGFNPGTVHAVVLVGALAIWLWDAVEGWWRALS